MYTKVIAHYAKLYTWGAIMTYDNEIRARMHFREMPEWITPQMDLWNKHLMPNTQAMATALDQAQRQGKSNGKRDHADKRGTKAKNSRESKSSSTKTAGRGKGESKSKDVCHKWHKARE